jgi:hypothetical protein
MPATYESEPFLTDAQRDKLLQDLDRDGFFVLGKMPDWMLNESLRVIDGFVEKRRMFEPDASYINYMNVVELDPIFRRMMMYKPMLQMAYDAFGPLFILQQDQFAVKWHDPKDPDATSVNWHVDAPENFPAVNGVVGLHTLRFGFLLSDATPKDSGYVEFIRGSHKKYSLAARRTLHWQPYAGNHPADFETDRVEMRVEAGTIVAFNTVTWHRALANRTANPRKIVYIQFCPTWMRPLNRVPPTTADLQRYTAEERWLLGEERPPADYVWPRPETVARMSRFARTAS